MDNENSFERFNDEARRALQYAHEEAHRLGHNSIGTAHLLLGLMRDPQCVAARALRAMQLDLATIRRLARPVASQAWSVGEAVRLTPGGKRVIERAVFEANQAGDKEIGSEHLLLGLFTGQEEAAEATLTSLGASLDEARRCILVAREHPEAVPAVAASRISTGAQHWQYAPALRFLFIYAVFIACMLILVNIFPRQIVDGINAFKVTLLQTFPWNIQPVAGWFPLAILAVFLLLVVVFLLLTGLPSWYTSLILPHREGKRGRETPAVAGWLRWQGKLLLVTFLPIGLFVELILLLWAIQPQSWLLWSVLIYFVYSAIFTRFRTELIISRFYQVVPPPREELTQRLVTLLEHQRTPIRGVFVMNSRQKPLRANAYCVGWGRSCRILLTDTLLAHFPPEEIEVIVAHELGHFVRMDSWKYLIARSLGVLCLLTTLQYIHSSLATSFLLNEMIMIFPLLWLAFYLFSQFYSRRLEYRADEYALQLTGQIQIFKSAMRRLATINLMHIGSRASITLFASHPTFFQRQQHADEFASRQRAAGRTVQQS